MTVFDAENGTNGTSCTAANSGWTSFARGTSAVVLFNTNSRYSGNLGYLMQTSSTAAAASARWSGNTVATTGPFRLRFYYRASSRPGQNARIVRILRSSETQSLVSLYQTSTGTLVLTTNGTNTTTETTRFTSTLQLALNTWYRIEIVVNPGSATTNGTVGLGVALPTAALTTTNSGNNVYYYSSALDLGAGLGIGSQDYGRTESGTSAISWAVSLDTDVFQMDNTSFTATPSTWIGPNLAVISDTLLMRGTPTFDNFFSYVQRQNGIVMAASNDLLTIGPAPNTTPGLLSMDEPNDILTIGGSTVPTGALPTRATPQLAVAPAAGVLTAALAAGVSPAMALAGLASMTAVLPMAATTSALYGALRTQLAALGVTVTPRLLLEVVGLFQDTWLSSVASSFAINNTDISHVYVLPLVAGAGMVEASEQWIRFVLASRGTPTFTVAGTKASATILSVRGTLTFAVAGRDTLMALVPLTAAGRLLLAGVSVGDLINYDRVMAYVLRQEVGAVLFIRSAAARLRDSGSRKAKLRTNAAQARPIRGAMLARVQE